MNVRWQGKFYGVLGYIAAELELLVGVLCTEGPLSLFFLMCFFDRLDIRLEDAFISLARSVICFEITHLAT